MGRCCGSQGSSQKVSRSGDNRFTTLHKNIKLSGCWVCSTWPMMSSFSQMTIGQNTFSNVLQLRWRLQPLLASDQVKVMCLQGWRDCPASGETGRFFTQGCATSLPLCSVHTCTPTRQQCRSRHTAMAMTLCNLLLQRPHTAALSHHHLSLPSRYQAHLPLQQAWTQAGNGVMESPWKGRKVKETIRLPRQ